MSNRSGRKGFVWMEFLSLFYEIEEDLENGRPVAHIWKRLRAENKFTGCRAHFRNLVVKHMEEQLKRSKTVPTDTNNKVSTDDGTKKVKQKKNKKDDVDPMSLRFEYSAIPSDDLV